MTPDTHPAIPAPRVGVLLVNLGTPDAPTPRAVRRYLAEFLHDHRVVQLSRWLWCPLLHFVILPLRGPKVAAKYAEIWMGEGSPPSTSRCGMPWKENSSLSPRPCACQCARIEPATAATQPGSRW